MDSAPPRSACCRRRAHGGGGRAHGPKVDIERLRQHLIDMNEVVLRSAVLQRPVARTPEDGARVARIRGPGFAGLMTAGSHHPRHHLAMAKGEALNAHGH